jgi:hypothetical protein
MRDGRRIDRFRQEKRYIMYSITKNRSCRAGCSDHDQGLRAPFITFRRYSDPPLHRYTKNAEFSSRSVGAVQKRGTGGRYPTRGGYAWRGRRNVAVSIMACLSKNINH